MTKKLSIVLSGLLLSTTAAFSADSIDSAFKEGTSIWIFNGIFNNN